MDSKWCKIMDYLNELNLSETERCRLSTTLITQIMLFNSDERLKKARDYMHDFHQETRKSNKK